MLLLLVATTTLEKMKAVPQRTWLNIALGVVALFLTIILVRKAAGMNKMVLTVIILVAFSGFGFNWIYYRNEPKFMTPIIEQIAKFFPSAGKQAEKEKRAIGP